MYADLCLVIVSRLKHDDIVVYLYSYLAVKLEFDDIVCCWTTICSMSSNENKADPIGPLLIYLFISKRTSAIYFL